MQPRFFKSNIESHVLYIKVDQEDGMYTVRLGSSELQDCASVNVYADDPYADLQGFLYDRLCSSNIPLSKANNGTVKMVLSLLKVTLDVFPYITHFRLMDMSMVDCESLKKSVLLSDMYFFLHGMTWYEKRFHATPTFKYNALKEAFHHRPSLPFEVVWSYMPKDMGDKIEIKKLYNMSSSWHEFFQKWHAIHGCVPFMHTYRVQGSTLMGRIHPPTKTLHGTTWIIQAKTLDFDDTKDVELGGSRVPKIQWSTGTRPMIRLFGGGEMYFGNHDHL